MDTKVSVIVPVYNVVQYLAEALTSIIQQDYKNLDIIVIDDGSTDGSGELCDTYAKGDSRIRVVHQENKGLSSARNVGIDMAEGQAIVFLDSDDAYKPEAIKILATILEESKADIVTCHYSTHDTQRRMAIEPIDPLSINPRIIKQDEALRKIIEGSIETTPWDKMYRKKVFQDIRFPEGHIYEGTYIIFDLFSKAEIVALTEAELIMHRVRPGSICNTYSLKHIIDLDYASEHYCEFVNSHTPNIFSYTQQSQKDCTRIRALLINYLYYSYKYPYDRNGVKTIRKMMLNVDIKKRFGNAVLLLFSYIGCVFCFLDCLSDCIICLEK